MIDRPVRTTGAELRTETTAPRLASRNGSAGTSCSMLLLAPLLALIRVPVHELPIREFDAEHKARRRLAGPAAALGTRRLGFPLLSSERAIRQHITLAWHASLRNRGPEGPLSRSGDVSYEAMREIGVRLYTPFCTEPFLFRVARLGEVLDLERPQIHDRQILEVEDPDIAGPLEAVRHYAVGAEVADVDVRRPDHRGGPGFRLAVRLGRDARELGEHTLLDRVRHDGVRTPTVLPDGREDRGQEALRKSAGRAVRPGHGEEQRIGGIRSGGPHRHIGAVDRADRRPEGPRFRGRARAAR